MENKNQNNEEAEYLEAGMTSESSSRGNYLVSISILISSIILAGTWIYTTGPRTAGALSNPKVAAVSGLEQEVLPSDGVTLPVVWGDLGVRMVDAGIIDSDKFKSIYEQRGTFTNEYRSLLTKSDNGKLKITSENSGYLLNLLWALGLGNKNEILEKGEMMNPAYGGAQNFASTGGWTVSKGSPMNHYSRHTLVSLTPEQQALVDKVSKGIYRPCCGNSTHFPDCNHGMAMLGLLELMASQGVSEQQMWETALEVNSYWFPNNYLTIATYMKNKGVEWKDVNPQEMLGANYSSNQGFAKISSQVVTPERQQAGNGCGIDAGAPAAQQPVPQSAGCGV